MKDDIYTVGYVNGYWLSEYADPSDVDGQNLYITGIADGFVGAGDERFCRSSELDGIIRNELVGMVRLYYKEKPLNKSRQIVAVIRQILSDGELFKTPSRAEDLAREK
jgi:hypothetical protein